MNTPTQDTEHAPGSAIGASQARTPDELAVRSASLRNLAVNMKADPGTLHNAADMLYDASRELEMLRADNQRLREQVAQLTEALRSIASAPKGAIGWALAQEAQAALSAVERGQK